MYIYDIDLTREIIICKGKGMETDKLFLYFDKIIYEYTKRFNYSYDDSYDYRIDCLLFLIKNYKKFDDKRYKKSFPYITEIIKRYYFNKNIKKNISFDVLYNI